MQITLNQEEIELALDSFVRSQINVAKGQKIIFDLKAGRGDNGFSATLDIVPADTPVKAFSGATRSASQTVSLKTVSEKPVEEPAEEAPTTEEQVDDTRAEEPEKTPDTTEDTSEAESAPKGRSLFSKTGS